MVILTLKLCSRGWDRMKPVLFLKIFLMSLFTVLGLYGAYHMYLYWQWYGLVGYCIVLATICAVVLERNNLFLLRSILLWIFISNGIISFLVFSDTTFSINPIVFGYEFYESTVISAIICCSYLVPIFALSVLICGIIRKKKVS